MSSSEKLGTGQPPATHKASAAWPVFEKKLAETLPVLGEDQFLIVSLKRRHGFVQFAAHGGFGMRAETVSNHYLADVDRLAGEQVDLLGTLGWIAPTGAPDEATPDGDPDGSPNFHRDFEAPVAWDEVARLAVETLREVWRVPHPGGLQYEAFDDDGEQILLPTLGLARAPALPPHEPPEAAAIPDLRQTVLQAAREMTGEEDVDFDADGEIAIRFGSALAVIRPAEESGFVRVYSPVLTHTEGGDALLRRLNEWNSRLPFVRLRFQEGAVLAEVDVSTHPLVPEQLKSAIGLLGRIADDIDDELQAEFGGRTLLGEFRPSALKN